MSKRFVLRILGVVLVVADLFFVLYLYHSAALTQAILSQSQAAAGQIGAAITSNGGGWVSVSQNSTISSLAQALETLDGGAVWLLFLLVLGLLFCLAPRWLLRVFELGEDSPS